MSPRVQKILIRVGIGYAVLMLVFGTVAVLTVDDPATSQNGRADSSSEGNSAPDAAAADPSPDAVGQLAQLQTQKVQLNALLAQCVQITVNASRDGAIGSALGGTPEQTTPQQMTPQYCDSMTPQWYSQLAVVDAKINRLQGLKSTPCSASGVC